MKSELESKRATKEEKKEGRKVTVRGNEKEDIQMTETERKRDWKIVEGYSRKRDMTVKKNKTKNTEKTQTDLTSKATGVGGEVRRRNMTK